jgi:hypothetical protein
MADLVKMEIAGITFIISCEDSVILQEFSSIYQPFLKKTLSAGDSPTIHIQLELHDLPDTSKMTKIFETDHSWSMYTDHDEYVIALYSRVFQDQAVWLARFNETFSKTVVYCGELLRREIDGGKMLSPVLYPLDQLLMVHILTQNHGALIHAAGIELHGNGYIFPGRSGGGKSTLMFKFAERKGFGLLSDDRMAVRKIDHMFLAYGTPWAGEAGIADNKSAPLAGIFFISHGSSNRIEPMGPREAFERLMPVTSIPWYHEKMMTKALSFCDDLLNHIPAYELHFKPDVEVADDFRTFVSA